jgi:hypothetical protein
MLGWGLNFNPTNQPTFCQKARARQKARKQSSIQGSETQHFQFKSGKGRVVEVKAL